MSDMDDLKVSATADTGIKNQWGRGLFYHSDGRKRTLDSKTLFTSAAIGFGLVAILLMMQSGSEQEHQTETSATVPPPPDITVAPIINVPPLAEMQDVSDAPLITPKTPKRVKAGAHQKGTTKDEARLRGPQLIARPRAVKIPPGAMVKAVLLSGASNGPVRAEIKESLSFAGERVIEEGAILLGQGQSGEDRLTIRFTQMVFKDGAVETVDAQGCDASDNIPGLKGSKVGNQAMRLATGIALTFVGGVGEALQDTTGQGGVVVRAPSLKNAMLNGAATTALDQSHEILSDVRNKPPVIEVPQGTVLTILFQKD